MYYEISDGERTVSFNYSRPTSLTDREAYAAVEDKHETTSRLRAAGVPAPKAQLFDLHTTDVDDILEAANMLGLGLP